jgi:ferric-dicitrate binding protein FerR (iron transport regulator)
MDWGANGVKASGTRTAGQLIDEAADAVTTVLGPATWYQRWRIRQWIRRSPTHAQEFILAFLIVESCRHVDAKRSINVQGLLDEAHRTVVPLNADSGVPSKVRSWQERQGGRSDVRHHIDSLESGTFSRLFGGISRRTAISLLILPALPLLAPAAPLPAVSSFATAAHETRTISLESGSAVSLNELSSITVEHGWTGYTVHLLQGDAFFGIQHKASRRVSVAVGNVRIEHLGTRFDVRRTLDEATVSVLEGQVTVTSTGASPIGEASPQPVSRNQKQGSANYSITANAGTEVAIHGIRANITLAFRSRAIQTMEHDSAWTKGWLDFNGETLKEVASRFNAHNRRQIVIIDPSIADLQVGGRFLAGDVESSIAALALGMPICVVPGGSKSDDKFFRLARRNISSPPLHHDPNPDKPAAQVNGRVNCV